MATVGGVEVGKKRARDPSDDILLVPNALHVTLISHVVLVVNSVMQGHMAICIFKKYD